MATSVGSHSNTHGLLIPFLTDTLGFQLEHAHAIHRTLRKIGHVTAYAIFAILLWRALRPARHAFALTVLGGVLLATSDETLQSFMPSRGGSVRDVLLDTAGVLLGCAVAAWWRRRRSRVQAPAAPSARERPAP